MSTLDTRIRKRLDRVRETMTLVNADRELMTPKWEQIFKDLGEPGAALVAVLDLHKAVEAEPRDEDEPYYCGYDGEDYPCGTVEAIARALEIGPTSDALGVSEDGAG